MKNLKIILPAMLPMFCAAVVCAQEKEYPTPPPMVPEMTEFWTPQPRIVTPADFDAMVAPPSDAIVLLGKEGTSEWQHRDGSALKWDYEDGVLTVKPQSGDIVTKREFGDCQLHVEWRSPTVIEGTSQGRGNSGIFMQGRYEVQVLDNYGNESYANGQAGSIYKQSPPLVNPATKPGKWNVYDIIYTAPRFKEDGSLQSRATITIIFNGVVVQNNTAILGATEFIGLPSYKAHGKAPIIIQDHLNPVGFRNIWIREL